MSCSHGDYHYEKELITTVVTRYVVRQKLLEDGKTTTQRSKSVIQIDDPRNKTKGKTIRKWCTDCGKDVYTNKRKFISDADQDAYDTDPKYKAMVDRGITRKERNAYFAKIKKEN